jgi:hypothetical protein
MDGWYCCAGLTPESSALLLDELKECGAVAAVHPALRAALFPLGWR